MVFFGPIANHWPKNMIEIKNEAIHMIQTTPYQKIPTQNTEYSAQTC
jgi:hypothetical protein